MRTYLFVCLAKTKRMVGQIWLIIILKYFSKFGVGLNDEKIWKIARKVLKMSIK